MSVDWNKFNGKATEGFKAEALDVSNEFVLELVAIDLAENVTSSYKGDERVVNRLKTEWQVVGTQTKVWQFFNLPASVSIKPGEPPTYSEKLKFVVFARQIRQIAGEEPEISIPRILPIGLRIRGFLNKDKESDYYHIDLKSVGSDSPQQPSQANRENQILVNTLKMYATEDEARTALKQIAPEKMVQFELLWNLVVKERAGSEKAKATAAALGVDAQKPNGPLIDADKQQAQALANGNGKPGQ